MSFSSFAQFAEVGLFHRIEHRAELVPVTGQLDRLHLAAGLGEPASLGRGLPMLRCQTTRFLPRSWHTGGKDHGLSSRPAVEAGIRRSSVARVVTSSV